MCKLKLILKDIPEFIFSMFHILTVCAICIFIIISTAYGLGYLSVHLVGYMPAVEATSEFDYYLGVGVTLLSFLVIILIAIFSIYTYYKSLQERCRYR